MIGIGTMVLATCFFVNPPQPVEGLPEKDPHEFLDRPEACTCCHDVSAADRVEPHRFTVDIIENCMRCHGGEMLGGSHPMVEAPAVEDEELPVDGRLPVDEENRITCGTCHNPHLDGLTTERYAPAQQPLTTRIEQGREVAYYRSYMLRLHAPEAGNDPTCAACHHEYF